MGRINCGECGREVSDTAYTCPHCGHDVRVIKQKGYGCRDCVNYDYCSDHNSWQGPSGYPCLEWRNSGIYDDD